MDLKSRFLDAVTRSKELPEKPGTNDLLALYGLYKQANDGDVSGDRPQGFDFKAIAKYDAWAKLTGKSNEEAMEEYIAFVEKLHSNPL